MKRTITPIFNISPKKRLFDPLVIETEANKRSYILLSSNANCKNDVQTKLGKPMEYWITKHPLLVYKLVYQTNEVELARDSHSFLMKVLKESHPRLYLLIQEKKANHRKRKLTKAA